MDKYRSDIDGLRAIAVLAVVIFHVDPHWLPGGFIGVDIFFVISGFLITSIIFRQTENNSFSYKEFYRRRIKRIIPVLTVVIFVTLFIAHFLFTPDDFLELSHSSLAAQLSVANVFFTYGLDTSYFATDSSLQPLLHTWSLGVEEQFYLIYPVLFVASIKKFGLKVTIVLMLLISIISLLISQLSFDRSPTFSYYMLPSRSFELLLGAVATLIPVSNQRSGNFVSLVLSVVGLVLIGSSLYFINEAMQFPGINALPIVIGVALLLYSGKSHTGFIHKSLSIKPLVWVGLISYSLYLWHWPVLAFFKYLYIELTLLQKILSIIIMLILSVLSYQLVEKPFRNDDRNFSMILKKDFVIPTLCLCFFTLLIQLSSGLGLYRFNSDYADAYQSHQVGNIPIKDYENVCQRALLTAKVVQDPKCIYGTAMNPDTLLWGDSKATNYIGVLNKIALQKGFSYRNLAHSSCPPSIVNSGSYVIKKTNKRNCDESAEVVKLILGDYENLIISASWNSYITRHPEYADVLKETIRQLKMTHKNIILLGDMPRTEKFDRACYIKKLKLNSINCRRSAQSKTSVINNQNQIIKDIAQELGVGYYDVTQHMCPGEHCINYNAGSILYFDGGHLNYPGSEIVGQWVVDSAGDLSVFDRLIH